MLLRHAGGELAFAMSDITRMLDAGRALPADALLTWLRDLSVLAVTLRDDMRAGTAARQLERGLIEPLVVRLDQHVEGVLRADKARANAKADKLSLINPFESAMQPKAMGLGAALRSRRRS